MEHQSQAKAQYSRQECLDIRDIHSEVEADVLEGKVVNIFEKLGCNIPSNCTEACDRVSKKSASYHYVFKEGLPASFGCEKGSMQNKNG